MCCGDRKLGQKPKTQNSALMFFWVFLFKHWTHSLPRFLVQNNVHVQSHWNQGFVGRGKNSVSVPLHWTSVLAISFYRHPPNAPGFASHFITCRSSQILANHAEPRCILGLGQVFLTNPKMVKAMCNTTLNMKSFDSDRKKSVLLFVWFSLFSQTSFLSLWLGNIQNLIRPFTLWVQFWVPHPPINARSIFLICNSRGLCGRESLNCPCNGQLIGALFSLHSEKLPPSKLEGLKPITELLLAATELFRRAMIWEMVNFAEQDNVQNPSADTK